MGINEIEKLLTRYYDGETNDTEEKELKRFFAQEDVPAHLRAEKEIFMHISQASGIPDGLEDRLNRLIDKWDTDERRMLKVKKHTRTLRLQWIGSIAASLLILFSVGIYLHKPAAIPAREDTCATAEEAYAQAQKALVLLSSSLNKGIEKVETVQETTERIQENINEQLNRINNIKQ